MKVGRPVLLFMSVGWDYVSELRPANGILFIPRWCMNMESDGGIIMTGENRRTRVDRPVRVSLFHHKPTCTDKARTRASAVKARRLTAWVMARPVDRPRTIILLMSIGLLVNKMADIRIATSGPKDYFPSYCNVLDGFYSQWNFIALKIQYTTVNYNQ
jgi:hypothetical protein